ncbi:hypothetical protein [Halorubrum sp. BOL3-1]|uniref:hypothetical protein n=1 Tax=Halorubrum sp. BOL3-1 TaxID=2497325 RepID=UPI0014082606|nr:hypothetical protein [Halorubrum sp. BOL3-1]
MEEFVEYYRAVDGARRAGRLDVALGELNPEPEAEDVEAAEPASPEPDADPFDWV